MSATAQANQQQLGVVISPDYTSRTYTTAGTFQGTTILPEEGGRIGWRAGLDYHRRLGAQMWFHTGLRLVSYRNKTTIDDLRFGSELVDGVYVNDPSLPRRAVLQQSDRFVEIPLLVRYTFRPAEKLQPYVAGGLAAMLYRNTRTVARIDGGTPTRNTADAGAPRAQGAAIVAVGLSYTARSPYRFFVQPTFRHHFVVRTNQLVRGGGFQRLPWAAGLEVGVRRGW